MFEAGIDYGLGKTNIDLDTGIRYGVVSANSLDSWIYDEIELHYGDPCCPHCGSEDLEEQDCGFICKDCNKYAKDWECYPDTPTYQYIDNGEIKAELNDYNNLFIFESKYFTYARFCSPCYPGAGDLDSPDKEHGVKTYCLGHDYYYEGKAPYPVYSVETGELIN